MYNNIVQIRLFVLEIVNIHGWRFDMDVITFQQKPNRFHGRMRKIDVKRLAVVWLKSKMEMKNRLSRNAWVCTPILRFSRVENIISCCYSNNNIHETNVRPTWHRRDRGGPRLSYEHCYMVDIITNTCPKLGDSPANFEKGFEKSYKFYTQLAGRWL